jgi:Family of unknown function (DUF6278)
MARGVAVYGSGEPGGDTRQLGDLLGQCQCQCRRLQGWAGGHRLALTGVTENLVRLDQAIDHWGGEPDVAGWLGNEAGLFAGTVIIGSVRGTSWALWPNGHPVVRLASGRDLDVVALVHDRVASGRPRLAVVYADAAGSRGP